MTGFAFAATLVTALGCGLVAGVFFAFSSFVMDALKRLPAPEGIAAMNSINERAPTPPFMTALFGTAVTCLGLAVWALASPDDLPLAPLLAGAAFYVIGTLGTTMAANVPLNNRLAATEPRGAGAAATWASYLTRWTAWNHARTVTSLAAAAAYTIALAL